MRGSFSNRLAKEKSPYLLQHACNPVEWYPWGEEAFQAAKDRDKPIFLSIGYATCHWCHVMERESFENPEIASLLNKVFICIKVDREEHPEVDALYMDFAQSLMSSGGGWPLNVLLTPDLKPFYAVTYLPPENNHGLMGLKTLCEHVGKLWQSEEKPNIFKQADEVIKVFEELYTLHPEESLDPELIHDTAKALMQEADSSYGGMKGSPKFPSSYYYDFLFRYQALYPQASIKEFAFLSLEMISRGGIYDHIGGGFSRYSVDSKWLIPHFEKMLYDNALLVASYLEGYLATQDSSLKTVAQETLDYVLREMTSSLSGFYSAQDADTEGGEGVYYGWTLSEMDLLLSQEIKDLFIDYYHLTEEGNFEGLNILYRSETLEEFANRKKLSLEQVKNSLHEAKEKLLHARGAKEQPLKDDKILVSWNGLMIDAMARASWILSRPDYLKAAIQAALFIKDNLYFNGRLLRRFREGEAKYNGHLEDSAYLIKGLLTLFEVTLDEEYLRWAQDLMDYTRVAFKGGDGAFYSAEENPTLLLRKYEFSDGSEPSSNSVHAENLLRLYEITADDSYLCDAEDIFKAGQHQLEDFPLASVYQAKALLRYYDTNKLLIVVALDEAKSLLDEIKVFFVAHYIPHMMLLIKEASCVSSLDILKDKHPIDGQTAVYVCKQGVCFPPVITIEDLKKLICPAAT